MEKPVENYLKQKDIDFPYCLSWANHNWSRTWVGGDKDILMEVKYGDETEWERHFQYLLPYFKDKRYIRMDNKPILMIYQPQLMDCYQEMLPYLQRRAKEEGLNGLTIIAQNMFEKESQELEKLIDYKIQYEPNYSLSRALNHKGETLKICPQFFFDVLAYRIKGAIKSITKGKLFFVRTYSYDKTWKYILKRPMEEKVIPGAFVKCDVTPRRQDRAVIFKGATPEKFAEYMDILVKKLKNQSDYLFLTAWNEWGEGMYLEPDEKDGYAYLEGVMKSLK